MADAVVRDTPQPEGPYEIAVGVRFGYQPSRFVITGIGIDDAGCTLNVIVQAQDDPNWVRHASISLPVGVSGDDLIVGTPRISYRAAE